MLATLLQLAGLVGIPVGGFLGVTSSAGGLVVGCAVSCLLVGDALEKSGS
jgi:hypothetical protein